MALLEWPRENQAGAAGGHLAHWGAYLPTPELLPIPTPSLFWIGLWESLTCSCQAITVSKVDWELGVRPTWKSQNREVVPIHCISKEGGKWYEGSVNIRGKTRNQL